MSTPVPPASPATGAATNPAEVAREAFKRLAVRRIAPTPDAYRDVYNEISGIVTPAPAPVAAPVPDPGAEVVLTGFAATLSATPGELADFGRRLNRAVKVRDWEGYARNLSQLAEKYLRRTTPIDVLGIESNDER